MSAMSPTAARNSSRASTSAVHDNLEHLALEMLDVVNLRVGGFRR
jgi:hypothetical protein